MVDTVAGAGPTAEDGAAAWSASLRRQLEGLESCHGARAGLQEDIAAYVLSGEPRAVLAELAARPRALSEHLRLCGFAPPLDVEALRAFYAGFSAVPPAVAMRWSQVVDAGWNDGAARHHGLSMPDGSQWAEHLLWHASTPSRGREPDLRARAVGPGADCMEALLAASGLAPQALLLAAFTLPAEMLSWGRAAALLVSDLPGFPAQLQRNLALVRPLLAGGGVEQRAVLAELLAQADPATLAELAPEVLEFVASGSKQVRAAAEPLLLKGGLLLAPALRKLAEKGKNEQRLHALRGLWLIAGQAGDAALQASVRSLALADKSAAVQEMAAGWEPAGAAAPPAGLPVLAWAQPPTPQLDAALAALKDDIYMTVRERNDQAIEDSGKKGAPPLQLWDYLTDSDASSLRAFLAQDSVAPPALEGRYGWSPFGEPLQAFAAAPGVAPEAVLKAMLAFAPAREAAGKILVRLMEEAYRAHGRPSLLELQQLLEQAGVPAEQVFDDYFYTWSHFQFDWQPEEVSPFLEHHQELVRRRLAAPGEDRYGFDRMKLYRAVAASPRLCDACADVLFEQALGAQKSWRVPAQDALAGLAGKEERIVAALASGKAEARTAAAAWLMRLNHASAVPALEAAVAKEKHDVTKGAMLDALQRFGQPVEKYLDRAALLKESVKALEKGVHEDLAWFPWGAIPEVAWADSGDPVAPQILKFQLAQAFKQKNPEPNAVLRKFCGMFEAAGRERFGQFVLECWLAHDVSAVSPADAAAMAAHDGRALHADMQLVPGLYQGHAMEGRSEPELVAWCLKQRLSQPAGNAVASKGILAVAAACAGGRAAAPVERYLKAWYGTRPSQGKSLIAMLAWIDHPSATQLVLAVGSRFRTRSFQEEASRQVEALAERKGWTLDELADRTVPSAGFDETGVLELRYGADADSRAFTARLGADFKVALFNAEGKALAALPEPRADEDGAMAREAKAALSAAKKELKTIVSQQTDRLYEALCTEREWCFGDWQQYLNRHPIVRRLAQQLVWAEVRDGRVLRTFRPLDDGTLTSRHDEALEPAPDARIRLAHDTVLGQEEVAGWLAHLADYEVAPLFPQLGKGVYALSEALRHAAGISDFEGHMIKAFTLRTRAQKLGYTRGATQDGGWFYSYDKRFPTLGLTAHIEFSGNSLPESDRKAALKRLSFTDNRSGAPAPLGKVPAVLLSECYHDKRLLAAAGSGYTGNWQANVE